MLYGIGDAVISTDRNGTILHMNPEAERLTGVTEVDVVGTPLRTIYRLFHEEDGREVECAISRALRNDDNRKASNGMLLRNAIGEEIPILERATTFRTDVGDVDGVVIVFHDQSAQRERLRMIEESERKYRALFEATADGIVLYAARGTAGAASTERVGNDERVIFDILDANDSYRSMNLDDDVLASTRIRPSDNEHGDELIRLCSLVMQDGSPRGGEYFDIITQRQYLITVYTPRPGQVALLLHDITERKSSENALLEKIRELERFNRLTIDRELRMIELKKEINVLLRELGRDEGYTVHA
jgi:PAS domain S-box-containing protein